MNREGKPLPKKRCSWVGDDPLMAEYHDAEWGVPNSDERHVFEHLALEIFQAGLSWKTILYKRKYFKEVFFDFDLESVAAINKRQIERILKDDRIIRNRRKIEAVVKNASAALALRREGIHIGELVWKFKPKNRRKTITAENMPVESKESRALAKELKKRGFTFVGPVGCYALMQAVGVVNDHEKGCWKWHGPC